MDIKNSRNLFGWLLCLVAIGLFVPAHVDAMNKNSIEKLFVAINAKNLENVKKLIKNDPLLVNAKNKDGEPALLKAIEKQRKVIAAFLIDNGADVNATDSEKENPLNLAILNNDSKLVNLLLDHGANANQANQKGLKPIHQAILLVAREPNLLEAIVTNKTCDVNARDQIGNTALHYAVLMDTLETIKFLIKHGALKTIKNNAGETPLKKAQMAGKTDIVNYLSIERQLPNETEIEFLRAIDGKNFGKVKNLIKKDPSLVNARDENQGSALSHAVSNNDIKIVKQLLDNGANADAADLEGTRPIHIAVQLNDPQEGLIEALAMNKTGEINAQDEKGNTALHYLADTTDYKTMAELRKHGARIDIKNKQKQTAYDIAEQNNNKYALPWLS